MNQIIFSDSIRNKLSTEFENTNKDLQIITAYCKLEGLKFVDENLPVKDIPKKLMVRFRLQDILSGATDLNIYEYCKINNWKMYIRFDLHAKTFIFDRKRLIIGSANLTSSGIGLGENNNLEMGMLAEITNEELERIESIFKQAVPMNDRIYALLTEQANNFDVSTGDTHAVWSNDILNIFVPDITPIFTQDMPPCISPTIIAHTYLDMLGLVDGFYTQEELKGSFIKSKAYRWLKHIISQREGKEIYFGELSVMLHEVLINDPKPYRKEVKELLANLLNWVVELEVEEISIDRPNYSQRIRLIS